MVYYPRNGAIIWICLTRGSQRQRPRGAGTAIRQYLDHDPSDHNLALPRVPEVPILVLCSELRKRAMPGRDHATRRKLRNRTVAAFPDCCPSTVQNNPSLVVDPSRCCSQDEFRETNDARSERHSHHRSNRILWHLVIAGPLLPIHFKVTQSGVGVFTYERPNGVY